MGNTVTMNIKRVTELKGYCWHDVDFYNSSLVRGIDLRIWRIMTIIWRSDLGRGLVEKFENMS